MINPGWREAGHARALVSRKKPNGKIAFGTFLVDLYCLGVKEVIADEDAPKHKYESLKPMVYMDGEPVLCDPHLGHTVIYGAINYARSLGFEPHPDFALHQHVLIPEPEITVDVSVEFGQDGQPFYVQGPEDDVDHILATLKKNVGEGKFGFISEADMGVGDENLVEFFDALMSAMKKK